MRRSVFVSLTLLCLVAAAAEATINLCSLSDSRATSWTLDGSRMNETRAKLLSTTNYGTNGTVREAISIQDIPGLLTPGSLGGCHTLFLGYIEDGELSITELLHVFNWVIDGGTLVATCDNSSHDAVCDFFGHPILGGVSSPVVPHSGQIGHPFFDGAFGSLSALDVSGNRSTLTATPSSKTLAWDAAENPVILYETLGRGEAYFLGDVDMLSDDTVTVGPSVDPSDPNDLFTANLFAFAGGDGLYFNDRFFVRATWRTNGGTRGIGHAIPLERDSGNFWFFSPSNVEMTIKVLNGCPINSRYWIFAAGLTNVEVEISVIDQATGTPQGYTNPLNTVFQPIQDTNAFATCPGL